MSDSRFTQVADRCWLARYDAFDVNVALVAGDAGLVIVDTNASARLGAAVLEDVRGVSTAPLVAAVNTHVHFDHTFGNRAFSEAGAELVCHENAAAALPAHAAATIGAARARESVSPNDEIAATEPVVPTRTFSSAMVLDLGDRMVELVHPGRGHTDGDLLVRVPDAELLCAGDLVEQSGPPAYGDDCWPLEWPATLDLLLGLVGPQTVVVPGHGTPVDRGFVEDQRVALGQVAETVNQLAGRGVPVDQALEQGTWPYPPERLVEAVRRGYAQLPRGGRQLPLA